MLFKWELIEKIVRGEKTQTRRPVKDGEMLTDDKLAIRVAVKKGWRDKIAVGRDYAVCPGRGKPGVLWVPNTGELCYPGDVGYAEMSAARKHITLDTVFAPPGEGFEFLRIRVLNIRCEDVRDISFNDVIDEGFDNRYEFWKVWCGFYDKPGLALINQHNPQLELKVNRPDELYQAWAYTFEAA